MFTSRTGLRPFTKKRAPSTGPPKIAGPEFGALLAIMQESNADLLGKFYGGAELAYQPSVAQRIAADRLRLAASRIKGQIPPGQGPQAPAWLREMVDKVVRKVVREESKYVVDQVAGYAIQQAVSEVQSAMEDAVTKVIPVFGLLATGWDALKTDGLAIDYVIRTGCAHRHGTQLRAGEPRAAAQAVGTIMKRKASMTGTSGATKSGAFAAGVAIEVGSFGAAAGSVEAVTGVITTVVDIIIKVVEMALDVLDFHRGNTMLGDLGTMVNMEQGTFVRMFNSCPLLGAYMLATPVIPTSAFVWLVTTRGYVSSVDEVERIAISHVNPLRLEASWIICNAPYELTNPGNATMNSAMQDAKTRSTVMDKSLATKAVERLTRDAYKTPDYIEGMGSGGQGRITLDKHAGRLNGLSAKLKGYKKTAKSRFMNETRFGRYLKDL